MILTLSIFFFMKEIIMHTKLIKTLNWFKKTKQGCSGHDAHRQQRPHLGWTITMNFPRHVTEERLTNCLIEDN